MNSMTLSALMGIFCIGCGGSASSATDIDAGPFGSVDAQPCEPFATRVCSNGDVVWQDSCGQEGERAEECLGAEQCVPSFGSCCLPTTASGPMPVVTFPLFVTFTHPARAAKHTLRLNLTDDPGTGQQLWLFSDVRIDGQRFTLGPKTDSDIGTATDRAFFFTRGGPNQVGEARAPEGAVLEQVVDAMRIRVVNAWSAGEYLITLTRGEPAPEFDGDWFDFEVALASDPTNKTDLGSMVATRANIDTPAMIDVNGGLFLQSYGGQENYSLFERLSAQAQVLLDDALPDTVTSTYGSSAETENTNTELGYRDDQIIIRFGEGVGRCTMAGVLL